MKKLVLIVLVLVSLPAIGSHIVGGEFELLYVSGNTYRVNMILYFDLVNGSPAARDASVRASIYRKSDNAFMGSILLPLISETRVSYTQPECSSNGLVTSKIIYSNTIELLPGVYNSAPGYYIAWERCCRNYSISNIFSEDTSRGGTRFAGQTFYLEFPPVVKDGKAFINSSPQLFPPLNDYACPYRPYYVDFAGTDVDGDSLTYTLTTPLNVHNSAAGTGTGQTATLPRPYPEVTWRPGFALDHIMNGAPDLKISHDGLLTVVPKLQGLYVFAVRIEQFRNKEKIGESRRDFQMLVTDGCSPDSPPRIQGIGNARTYDDKMNVTFANTVADADRCIQVRVSDPDSNSAASNFTENITIKVVGLGFKNAALNQVLPAVTTATLTNGSTKDFSICFPQCPYVRGPYEVGIIAFDDACSLPLADTLRVTVNVQPPPNTPPYFVTPAYTNVSVAEGTQQEWFFDVRDDEQDAIAISLRTDNFLMADAGMKMTILSQQNGRVTGKLSWDAYCTVYNYTQRTNFLVQIFAEDADFCNFTDAAKAAYQLAVTLPGNADPVIDTDLTTNTHERKVLGLQRKIYENLSFNVTGSDADNTGLVLDLLDRSSYNGLSLSFPKASGNTTLQSSFLWNISCDGLDLKKKDLYTFSFVVVDNANKCKIYQADTVDVQVKILPPDNAKPVLTITSLNPDLPLVNHELNVTLGQQIILALQCFDADVSPKNNLTLELIDAKGNVKPQGYSFTKLAGQSPMSRKFVWNPDCTIFEDGVYENEYAFTFRLADDNCYRIKADTIEVNIRINDVDATSKSFTPVNFFSPNGDGINDYYSMEVLNKDTGELENSLPPDNCTGAFQAIRVYNRWGKEVYKTTDRDFRWYGKGEAAGVYYYLIKYTNREYKGALSIHY